MILSAGPDSFVNLTGEGVVTYWRTDLAFPVIGPMITRQENCKTVIRSCLFDAYPYFGKPFEGSSSHGVLRNIKPYFSKVDYNEGGQTCALNFNVPNTAASPAHSLVMFTRLGRNYLKRHIIVQNGTSEPLRIGGGPHPYFNVPQRSAKLLIGNHAVEIDVENLSPDSPIVLDENPPEIALDIPGLAYISLKFTGALCAKGAKTIIWHDGERPNKINLPTICFERCIATPEDYANGGGVVIPPGKSTSFGYTMMVYYS